MRTRATRAIQKGFTLIELLIVIVIIGILAAVVIPQFSNVSDEAKTATLKGTAGTIASAAATNYALKQAGSTLSSVVAVATCTAASTLSGMTLPTNVSISTDALTAGTLGNCTLTYGTGTGSPTYVFQVMGA